MEALGKQWKYAARGLLLIFVITLAVLGMRALSVQESKIPVVVTHKVRNISAKEFEWQIATAAQPGDVLEHFALIQLSEDYPQSLHNIKLSADSANELQYRENTLTSIALGISKANANEKAKELDSRSGLDVFVLRPEEFIDVKWQTQVLGENTFSESEAPLLESEISVKAPEFSQARARSIISMFSTIERSRIPAQDSTNYIPRVISMNPRRAYQDLGTGIAIVGEDLAGITEIRIAETNRTIVWRFVSNELLEASIPAGLAPGSYTLKFEQKNNSEQKKLSFEILESSERAIVVQATPHIVRAGKRRTLVLQGIHLSFDIYLSLRSSQGGEILALENTDILNNRVLSTEIPEQIKKGDYAIFVGEQKQNVRVTVN